MQFFTLWLFICKRVASIPYFYNKTTSIFLNEFWLQNTSFSILLAPAVHWMLPVGLICLNFSIFQTLLTIELPHFLVSVRKNFKGFWKWDLTAKPLACRFWFEITELRWVDFYENWASVPKLIFDGFFPYIFTAGICYTKM